MAIKLRIEKGICPRCNKRSDRTCGCYWYDDHRQKYWTWDLEYKKLKEDGK